MNREEVFLQQASIGNRLGTERTRQAIIMFRTDMTLQDKLLIRYEETVRAGEALNCSSIRNYRREREKLMITSHELITMKIAI